MDSSSSSFTQDGSFGQKGEWKPIFRASSWSQQLSLKRPILEILCRVMICLEGLQNWFPLTFSPNSLLEFELPFGVWVIYPKIFGKPIGHDQPLR